MLAAGLKPAHLDWHSLRLDRHPAAYDLLLGLAREYGLALRVTGDAMRQQVQRLGLALQLTTTCWTASAWIRSPKPDAYAQLLHALPPGLSEWAVHPGLDTPELLALEPDGNHIRQTDYDFWTSPQAAALIEQEGILLIDYRALQAAWQG